MGAAVKVDRVGVVVVVVGRHGVCQLGAPRRVLGAVVAVGPRARRSLGPALPPQSRSGRQASRLRVDGRLGRAQRRNEVCRSLGHGGGRGVALLLIVVVVLRGCSAASGRARGGGVRLAPQPGAHLAAVRRMCAEEPLRVGAKELRGEEEPRRNDAVLLPQQFGPRGFLFLLLLVLLLLLLELLRRVRVLLLRKEVVQAVCAVRVCQQRVCAVVCQDGGEAAVEADARRHEQRRAVAVAGVGAERLRGQQSPQLRARQAALENVPHGRRRAERRLLRAHDGGDEWVGWWEARRQGVEVVLCGVWQKEAEQRKSRSYRSLRMRMMASFVPTHRDIVTTHTHTHTHSVTHTHTVSRTLSLSLTRIQRDAGNFSTAIGGDSERGNEERQRRQG